MMVLATFFPSLDSTGSNGMNVLNEVLKTTVDLGDLVGLYTIINRTIGKPELKVMIATMGWGGAQAVFSNLFSFWFGARSQEFDWKYIQLAVDSNITLAHVMSMAALVWIWTRTDLNQNLYPLVSMSLVLCVFRDLIIQLLTQSLVYSLVQRNFNCVYGLVLSADLCWYDQDRLKMLSAWYSLESCLIKQFFDLEYAHKIDCLK